MKTKYTILFIYLFLVLLMTGGAFIWQAFFPNVAEKYTVWNMSIGWQREIALWNLGVDTAIIVTLIKKNIEYAKILTFMATVTCFLLGGHHLVSALMSSGNTIVHWLGAVEVLGLGAGLGLFSLYKSGFFHTKMEVKH